jgi:addiction module RelE/StbE family toxin
MQIETHKQYDKVWSKLNRNQQLRVLAALKLFVIDPHHSKLRLHQLKGTYYPQYSISVGGDLRVHYVQVDAKRVVLMLVGTHSQLYG